MKKWWIVLTVLALVAAGFSAALAGGDDKPVVLKNYDVALIGLQTPMKIADAQGQTKTYRQAYLVRLFGDFPAGGAELMRLAIGEQSIPEFGGLPGGIYFMVFESKALDALTGREIRFRVGDRDWRASGVKFEPARFAPFQPLPEEQAFKRAPGGK